MGENGCDLEPVLEQSLDSAATNIVIGQDNGFHGRRAYVNRGASSNS
jgi:hypothetical protein